MTTTTEKSTVNTIMMLSSSGQNSLPLQGMKRNHSQIDAEHANSDADASMFEDLAAWIRKEGGFVHTAIQFDHEQRVVKASSPIQEGEEVLRIPRSVLICPSNIVALDDENGSSFTWGQLHKQLSKETILQSVDDCLVAVFLAHKPSSFQPYLSSLPSRSDLDCIPRRMTDQRLDALFGGSPLVKRVHDQRKRFQREHQAIQQIQTNSKSTMGHLSYEDFDDAMTVISSRAFAGRSADGKEETTLVPLLDLCNHERGALSQKKNLSYEFVSETAIVRSLGIQSGESLRITYGAQGNQQLLFNYGFAIPNNIEPDGSSNDAYEFFPESKSGKDDPTIDRSIFLRMGPKSYSYGCFVQALETFFEQAITTIEDEDDGETSSPPEEDDMEAFLNGCDAEEDMNEDDEVDYGIDAGCLTCSNLGCDGSLSPSKDAELRALLAFREKLVHLALSYKMSQVERQKLLNQKGLSLEYFAAVLVDSELTTLHFFAKAAEGIARQLDSTIASKIDPLPTLLSERSVETNYLQELSSAYMTIRHG